MEMTYNNAVVLPKNFAAHTEDEMMYLDGGISYTYKKGSKTGLRDCYGMAAMMATYCGLSALLSKASVAIATLSAGASTIFAAVFKGMSWYTGYLATAFFNAGEAAKAVYKKRAYTITINTFLGLPTSVHCS